MKINKTKLLISSIITLLPIPVGLLLYNRLPELVPIHWGADGNADGFAGRTFAVLGMPLILLAIHIIAVFATAHDPRNSEQNPKIMGFTMWIAPIISIFTAAVTYAAAFGYEFSGTIMPCIVIGLIFTVFGNYMPKCRPNSTVGLRVPWTLNSDENWKASHRFTGYVWFICGIACLALVFVPNFIRIIGMTAIIFAAIVLSIGYSYLYYRRQLKNGTYPTDKPKSKTSDLVLFIVLAALLVVSFVAVTTAIIPGEIEYEFTDAELILDSRHAARYRVLYSEIIDVELRPSDNPGRRDFGYGSSELMAGKFSNDELGNYLRYTYPSCKSVVVIWNRPRNVVVNCRTEDETWEMYETLKNLMNNE